MSTALLATQTFPRDGTDSQFWVALIATPETGGSISDWSTANSGGQADCDTLSQRGAIDE